MSLRSFRPTPSELALMILGSIALVMVCLVGLAKILGVIA